MIHFSAIVIVASAILTADANRGPFKSPAEITTAIPKALTTEQPNEAKGSNPTVADINVWLQANTVGRKLTVASIKFGGVDKTDDGYAMDAYVEGVATVRITFPDKLKDSLARLNPGDIITATGTITGATVFGEKIKPLFLIVHMGDGGTTFTVVKKAKKQAR